MSSELLDRVVESAKDAPQAVAEVTVEVLVTAKEHGSESLVTAALTRLIRAVLIAVSHMETGLINIVSAPSDLQALLLFLEEPAVIEELSRLDPLARARARGILRKAELYEAEGGCISADDAARLLNVTRQGIDKARQRGDVLALPRGRDGWTYPAWQFDGGHYLPGLAQLLKILHAHGPFVQASFLVSGHALLDGATPLANLRQGQIEEVLKVAEVFGQHGSS
jgi:hypothetical protein